MVATGASPSRGPALSFTAAHKTFMTTKTDYGVGKRVAAVTVRKANGTTFTRQQTVGTAAQRGGGQNSGHDFDGELYVDSPGPSAAAALARGVADSGVDQAELDAFLAANAEHERELFYTVTDAGASESERVSAARELAQVPYLWPQHDKLPEDEREAFDAAMADDKQVAAAIGQLPLIPESKLHMYGSALAERVWKNAVPNFDAKLAARAQQAADDWFDAQLSARLEREALLHASIADASAPAAERIAAGRDMLEDASAWPGLKDLSKDERVALWAASQDDEKMLAAVAGLPHVGEKQRHLIGGALAERLHRANIAPPAPPVPAEKPKNGYITMYKGKKHEVYANTSLEAQRIAADHFRVAKSAFKVDVYLAELAGEQVTHTITN